MMTNGLVVLSFFPMLIMLCITLLTSSDQDVH